MSMENRDKSGLSEAVNDGGFCFEERKERKPTEIAITGGNN